MVLQPHNLPEQLQFQACGPPIKARYADSDLVAEAYFTDILSGKIIESTNVVPRLTNITAAGCKEENG